MNVKLQTQTKTHFGVLQLMTNYARIWFIYTWV